MKKTLLVILFLSALFIASSCDDKKSAVSSSLNNNDRTINYNSYLDPVAINATISKSNRYDKQFQISSRELYYLKTNINSIQESDLQGSWNYLIERFGYTETRKISEYITKVDIFIFRLEEYELFLIQDKEDLKRVYPKRNVDKELVELRQLLNKYRALRKKLIETLGTERYEKTTLRSIYIYNENFCDETEQFCEKGKEYIANRPVAPNTQYVNPKTGIVHSSNSESLVPLGEFDGVIKTENEEFIDIDLDGLHDKWELEYFGGLSTGSNDDPDNDGTKNLLEFSRGTDPTLWTNKTELIQ